MNIQHIVSPVDFSEASDHGLAHAVELARVLGARLTLLHVYQRPTFAAVGDQDNLIAARLRQDAQQQLDALVVAPREPEPVVEQREDRGPVVRQLVRLREPVDRRGLRARIREERSQAVLRAREARLHHDRAGVGLGLLVAAAEVLAAHVAEAREHLRGPRGVPHDRAREQRVDLLVAPRADEQLEERVDGLGVLAELVLDARPGLDRLGAAI